jgi:hypothetical protein
MSDYTRDELQKITDDRDWWQSAGDVQALVEAAQGVIARWDSPYWKSGHTLDHITKLRTALAPFTGAKP